MAEHESIYVLMSKVMADVGSIGKNRQNTQQGFAFRGIDDVMNALHDVLAKHGVFYLPYAEERLDQTQERGANRTIWNRVLLKVRFCFYGPSGDSVDAVVWGESLDNADKASSKAHSMALKYALLEVFCIPTEDMDDGDAHTPEPQVSSRPPRDGQAQRERPNLTAPSAAITTDAMRLRVEELAIKKGLDVDDYHSLLKQVLDKQDIETEAEADRMMEALKK